MAGNNNNTIQIVIASPLDAAGMATAIAALSSTQLQALANALLSALQNQSAGVPASGQYFTSTSGFIEKSQ